MKNEIAATIRSMIRLFARQRRHHVCAHITWWCVKEAANWNCSSLCVYAQHALLLLCICQRAAFDYIQLSESGSRAPQQREDLLLMLRARALSLSRNKTAPRSCVIGVVGAAGARIPGCTFSLRCGRAANIYNALCYYICLRARCLWFVLSLSRSVGLSICGEARVSLFHLRQLICAALSAPAVTRQIGFPSTALLDSISAPRGAHYNDKHLMQL